MLRRILVLLGALLLSVVVGLASMGLVLSSSQQFARRLALAWRAGEIEFGTARAVDVNTAGFASLAIGGIDGRWGQLALQGALHLVDVEWRRGSWNDVAGPFDVGRSQLRFESGTLDLLSRPTAEDVVVASLPREFETWVASKLPGRVSGRALDCSFRAVGHPEATVQLRIEDLSIEQRASEGLRVRAVVASAAWRHGLLELRSEFGRPTLRVHLDDVDLASVSIDALARAWLLPWSSDFPAPISGRADIDMAWHGPTASINVRHYQTRVQVPGLSRPLERLSGTLQVTPSAVEWQVDEGWYSRSKVVGSCRVEHTTGHATGEFRLLDVIGDPDLGDPRSTLWRRLLGMNPLNGRCDVSLPIDGYPGTGGRVLFPRVELRFEGLHARGPRDAREEGAPLGVSGVLRLTQRQGEWEIQGDTVPSIIRGFRLPATRWRGAMTESSVRLIRDNLTGPRASIEIVRGRDGLPQCTVQISRLDLGAWVGRPLTRSEANFYLAGEWHPTRGLAYTGWFRWSGLAFPDGPAWPLRRPHSETRGEVFFNRHRGQDYLPSVALTDGLTLWVASGWVDREGGWELRGVAAHGNFPLPAASETADLIRRPRPSWERFTVRGPLLEWKAEVEAVQSAPR